MVYVLIRGATTSKAALKHLAYLDRKGELEIETDDGGKLVGAKAAQAIVDGWDLDLDAGKSVASAGSRVNHKPSRLVQTYGHGSQTASAGLLRGTRAPRARHSESARACTR
jgi:hypothetical protein